MPVSRKQKISKTGACLKSCKDLHNLTETKPDFCTVVLSTGLWLLMKHYLTCHSSLILKLMKFSSKHKSWPCRLQLTPKRTTLWEPWHRYAAIRLLVFVTDFWTSHRHARNYPIRLKTWNMSSMNGWKRIARRVCCRWQACFYNCKYPLRDFWDSVWY